MPPSSQPRVSLNRPFRKTWFAKSAMVGLLLLASVGCSKKVPVGNLTGTIQLDGSAFTDGMVVVANESKHVYMTGVPDADGHYEIKNLLLGNYRISIQPIPSYVPTSEELLEYLNLNIPTKYQLAETSGLETEIAEGDNTLDITLKK